MFALDTNVLAAAHREDHPGHQAAVQALRELAGQGARVVIPWPCVHEFLSVVTHPRVFAPPTPMELAVRSLTGLATALDAGFIGETSRHLEILARLLQAATVVGPSVHDARIAAICLGHGVAELWTADRDFSAFPALHTFNPLIGER